MANNETFQVWRVTRGGKWSTLAKGIETLAEAAEIALRLTRLQEIELGGEDEFVAERES